MDGRVWVGSAASKKPFTFNQDRLVVSGVAKSGYYSYLVKVTLEEDGFSGFGTWKCVDFQIFMDENMLQFRGNFCGDPICGARLGAEKPEPCLEIIE